MTGRTENSVKNRWNFLQREQKSNCLQDVTKRNDNKQLDLLKDQAQVSDIIPEYPTTTELNPDLNSDEFNVDDFLNFD